MDIVSSIEVYEARLRGELGGEVVEKDPKKKHEAMVKAPFPFLRATYWRWAEVVPDLCRELGLDKASRVIPVGDVHLENFGTWRDADGRLVWGVNDYDEAAEMPYVLDLMRLATSALVARSDGHRRPDVGDAIGPRFSKATTTRGETPPSPPGRVLYRRS